MEPSSVNDRPRSSQHHAPPRLNGIHLLSKNETSRSFQHHGPGRLNGMELVSANEIPRSFEHYGPELLNDGEFSPVDNIPRSFQHHGPELLNAMGLTHVKDLPSSPPSQIRSALLRLPLEIRQEIYFYAFLIPTGDSRPIQLEESIDNNDAEYWGTEQMTRLLRVNHQISAEAMDVLYSRFIFTFPHNACACMVRDDFSLDRFPNMKRIKNISIHICPYADSTELKFLLWKFRAQALCQALKATLPELKRITFSITFIAKVDENRKTMVVDAIAALAGLFRDYSKIELQYITSPGKINPRAAIVAEAGEIIKQRSWKELGPVNPKYVCCSETLRAWRRQDPGALPLINRSRESDFLLDGNEIPATA
jgi:hypothetical protein